MITDEGYGTRVWPPRYRLVDNGSGGLLLQKRFWCFWFYQYQQVGIDGRALLKFSSVEGARKYVEMIERKPETKVVEYL